MPRTSRNAGPWTIDAMRALLDENDRMVEEAILRIYDFQTEAEQAMGETTVNNGVGFSGCDAEFLSSLAQQIKRSTYPVGRRLSSRQLPYARKKIRKYAGQLVGLANAKAAARVTHEQPVAVSIATGPCPDCHGTRRVEVNVQGEYAEVPCPRCGDAVVIA